MARRPTASPPTSGGSRSLPRWASVTLKLALSFAVGWFLLARAGSDFDIAELREDGLLLEDLRWSFISIATLCQCVGVLVGATVWGGVVKRISGRGPPVSVGMKIWMVGGLGRYLPGKIFGVLGIIGLARRAGVAAANAGAAVGLASFLGIVGAALVGAFMYFELDWRIGPGRWPTFGLVLIPIALLYVPTIQARLLRLWYRLIRMNAPETAARLSMLRWTGVTFASWVAHAGAFWLLGQGLGIGIPPLIAGPAFALAWLVGHASPLPAGVGVRELGLVGLLAGHANEGDIVALLIVARVWSTLVELLVTLTLWLAVESPKVDPQATDH